DRIMGPLRADDARGIEIERPLWLRGQMRFLRLDADHALRRRSWPVPRRRIAQPAAAGPVKVTLRSAPVAGQILSLGQCVTASMQRRWPRRLVYPIALSFAPRNSGCLRRWKAPTARPSSIFTPPSPP